MNIWARTLATFTSITALSGIAAAPALADHDSTYFAVERTSVSVNSSGGQTGGELNPTGVRIKLGAGLSHAFDLEAQMGFADEKPGFQFDKFNADYAGVYLKGHIPLGFRSSIFGLGGWSWLELTETVGSQELADDRSGLSYGFGIETRLTDNIDLSADYMRYSQEDGVLYDEISAVNFGVKIYF